MAKNTDMVSVQQWVESQPLARIKRRELIVILDACGIATRQEVLVIVTRALREYVWYRRLWRWIKGRLPDRDLSQLRPDALDEVQARLDAAREKQHERVDG